MVTVLLVLMPAMTLLSLAIGAAAAVWMLASTSLQVVSSPERELTLTWPGYLSDLARRDKPRRPAEPEDRAYDPYQVPDDDEAATEEPAESRTPVPRLFRLLPGVEKYNEMAASWQPDTEPTYRQYLLGQAWTDLAATLTESGTRLVIRIQKPSSARDRATMEQMGPMLLDLYGQSLERLKDVVASDLVAAAPQSKSA